MTRKGVLLILIIFLTVASATGAAVERQSSPPGLQHRNILVLHSYAPDYAWTREINRGVMSVLDRLDWTNRLRIEYMDSKNIFSRLYLSSLANLYSTKYSGLSFDGIIATDNNALNFLEEYRNLIFPGATIVATGINGTNSVANSTIADNIVLEKADHAETLRQALAQNPEAKTVYIISDSSTTGTAISAEVKEVLPLLPAEIDYVHVPELPLKELQEHVATLPPKGIIYLQPYLRDAAGTSYQQGYVGTILSRNTSLPIYGSWEFQIGNGLVGGHVISAFRQGEVAAENLIALLEGQKDMVPFTSPESSLENLYDYTALTKAGIELELLAEGSRLLNEPVSLYSRHKKIILPALGIIAALAIIALLLLQNLLKQKVINRDEKAINALNSEIIETQRELVTTLGEVVENHSRDTGNHVKRVAKISRFLGEKVCLSPKELDILEAASPLHDVGKIGVSEQILHKPGRLTESEFEAIKEHTNIGRDILQASNRELFASACSIAHQHHERWDGSGYPRGLKGEEINIFARITMLADVYDALSNDRSYKRAWPEERVRAYIHREKGRFFDPELVEIFMEHYDEIRAIMDTYLPKNKHFSDYH